MRIVRLSSLLLLLALGGCISMAPKQEVQQAVAELPEVYSAVEAPGEYKPVTWWREFEDPVLDSLVDEALVENLDIAEAAARVERANAQSRLSRAALLPSIESTRGASYSNSSLSGSLFGNFPGGPSRLVNETYSLGLGASYELDLFGRARDDFRASRADAIAVGLDYNSVRLATIAEIISAYFEIVDTRRQIELSLLTSDILADRVARTDERYQRGLVESFELYQVRQDLRNVEASLPLLESALKAVEGRLAVLLADYPESLPEKLDQPLRPRLVFEPVPPGLPVELLAQRPDTAAAWERLEAARFRIGARRAERFPAIRLTASTGAQGASVGDALKIGENWLVNLGANIVTPIFDGGRIAANIASARASYNESAASYGRTVLNAYREVTVSVESYEEQRQRYSLILSQLTDAQASLDVQARRYEAGVGNYIGYLDALRAFYQVESSLSGAGRDVALARLGVHRALGGDWTINSEAEEDSAPLSGDIE